MGILGLMAAVTLALGLALSGCGHATLEAGGAYAPTDTNGVATAEADYDLFVVDSAYALAHDAVGQVFKFERDNRALLWKISPSIKHGLDQARAQVRTVDIQYATARTAYLASPVPANLTTLQQILAKAQQLTSTAQALLASQGLQPGFSPMPPGPPLGPPPPPTPALPMVLPPAPTPQGVWAPAGK